MNWVTAPLHGCSIFCGCLTELCAGGQWYPASAAQHRHGAAGAGVACRAALLSAPCTHAAENPGLAHGFWHRFLFSRFLTFIECVCVCLFRVSRVYRSACNVYSIVRYVILYVFFSFPLLPGPILLPSAQLPQVFKNPTAKSGKHQSGMGSPRASQWNPHRIQP